MSGDDEHVVSGTVEQRPTAKLVCRVEETSYRVHDPSDFGYCPMCGRKLDQ